MRTGIRNVVQVAVAALALGASSLALPADQGIAGRIAGKTREAAQQASERRESQRAEPRQQSRPAQSPSQPRSEPRTSPRNDPRASSNANSNRSGSTAQRNDRGRTTGPVAPSRNDRGQSGSSNAQPSAATPQTSAGSSSRNSRGVVGSVIQREYETRDPRPDRDRGNGRGNDRDHDRDRDHWDRDRDRHHHHYDRPRRTVRVIHHLPHGYRDYSWNGRHYYYYDGFWYRPYGGTYVSVSVPYGFFVASLPGSYTSVWVGGTRYYYSDEHYYTYEPQRRGYVVVPSPYGEEEEAYEDDLYVYPAQGQSEQQQADDRYECHRWAVAETDYDPIDDEYDAELREDYIRALTACLTGRGYTVR